MDFLNTHQVYRRCRSILSYSHCSIILCIHIAKSKFICNLNIAPEAKGALCTWRISPSPRGQTITKGGSHMSCLYYQEPALDEPIGCCNDDTAKIPSKTHQNCLCRSFSGIYTDFCPIYTKFQRKESGSHKSNAISRIFMSLIAHWI